MTPLSGQSVLVTGAAHGIGAEVARRLAARGARVSLVGLGADELRRVAADCPGAIVFDADVTDQEALDAAVAGTVEAFGGIDTVMANAGIAAPGFIRTMDPAAFERVIEVNLLGVWRTVRTCLPHVIERRGYVLPVASMAAILPGPGLSAYATAKTGVEAFGNALRVEVQGYGVKVGMLKGPLARTYPVSDAAEAVVRGIENRSRVVVCPRWLVALLAVKPLLPWVTEFAMRRDIGEFDRLAELEALAHGSDPVGAGGEAELAARGARTSTAH
jgi:NAD(P)-dependent dehydrogenase (short-subunit alcohol dehydrogenase family)